MSNNPVTNYSLSLKIGDTDLTPFVDMVTLVASQDSFAEKVSIALHMSRETYDNTYLPNKDSVKLEIASDKGMNTAGEIPTVDASFSYDMCVISESRTLSTASVQEEVPATDEYILVCIPRKNMAPLNKLITDKTFYNKTRNDMLEDLLKESGAEYEIQSEILEKPAVIEQCFIPPCRIPAAIRHLDHYFRLFKDGSPTYINYAMDGKLYIGSCNNNSMDAVSMYMGGDRDSWVQANAVRSGNTEEYKYAILFSNVARDYSMLSMATGTSQTFVFSPMNKLYSKLNKKLEEYELPSPLTTEFGKTGNSLAAIAKVNKKESWIRGHNGLALEETGNDDINYANSFISSVYNRANIIQAELEGIIVFSDVLRIGRRVKLATATQTASFGGDYYVDSTRFEMTPSPRKEYWMGKAKVILKSGIDMKKFSGK